MTEIGMNRMTTIQNAREDHFTSELLRIISELIQSSGREVTATKKQVPGEKGEIFTEVVIGLAVNVVYDIIRTAALRLSQRQDYSTLVLLNINGREQTLKEIIDN